MLIVASPSLQTMKHPWNWHGLAHVTHFACVTVGETVDI